MELFRGSSCFIHKSIFSWWVKSYFHHLHVLQRVCRWCSSCISLPCIWDTILMYIFLTSIHRALVLPHHPNFAFSITEPLPWNHWDLQYCRLGSMWPHILESGLPATSNRRYPGWQTYTPVKGWNAAHRSAWWNVSFLTSAIKFYSA